MTSPRDRVTHTDKGKLDQVFGSRFGHLERLGPSTWFLLIGHADGTETAMWFTSRDLPSLIETRERRR